MAKKKKKQEEKEDTQQDNLVQMQVLQEQVNQLRQYIDQYDTQLAEVKSLMNTLDDLKTMKGDEEVLIPITNGIFVHGKFTDAKKMKVNVGNGIVVDKSIDETKELLETQSQEIEKIRGQALIQFHEFVNHIQQLENV